MFDINNVESMFNAQSTNSPEGIHRKEFTDYMEREFALINFDKIEFGQKMMDLLYVFYDMNKGDPGKMNIFINIMKRIVDRYPLEVLKEEELIEIEINGLKIKKHPRYEWLEVMPDGTYWDSHGIAFVNPDGIKWYGSNGENRSTVQIEFPYYPVEKVVYL